MKRSIKIDLIISAFAIFAIAVLIYMRYSTDTNSAAFDYQGQRLKAYEVASSFNGKIFPELHYLDPVTSDSIQVEMNGRSLLVLMSKAGCNPCQIRELKNVDSLLSRINPNFSTSATAIYSYDNYGDWDSERMIALMLRKASQSKLPFVLTNSSILSDFMSSSRYPMVFLLEDNMIISSFLAIPEDDIHSYRYYISLEKLLNNTTLNVPERTENSLLDPSAYMQAKNDLKLTTIEGVEYRMNDFNNQVIFLNIWATWCSPCVQEMKSIQMLYDRFKASNEIDFILASNESLDDISAFMKERNYNLPIYKIENSDSILQYIAPMIPSTYIIDKGGKVVLSHKGAALWSHNTIQELINKLL